MSFFEQIEEDLNLENIDSLSSSGELGRTVK